MKYTRLGSSGLEVSRITLGCMSFGTPGTQFDWSLGEEAAAPVFRQAIELGITFWDQIHRFDPEVPVEEVMEALHDVVKAGKARYIGASSMWAWQFATLQHTAEQHGWTRFISMQDQYSLLQREEEREMFPLLKATGVGAIPWGPLGAGMVARPWNQAGTGRGTGKDDVDFNGIALFTDQDEAVVDAVQRTAEARGVSMAQIALAWVLHNPVVDAPIIGATKEHHLADAAAAVDIELTDDEVQRLEQHYALRRPSYFS